MLFRMRSNVLFRLFHLLTTQAGSIPADIRLIFENCYNDGMLASIKADEARLVEIKVMMTHLQNYNKAKNVFAEYRASGYSRKYYEKHRDVLALRQAAKQAFDEYVKEHGKDTPLPRLKDLHAEYAIVLEIVEVMLEKDEHEKERQQLQQEQNRKQR